MSLPASALDPSCSQQTPADKDHAYHVVQDNHSGPSGLRKRHNDTDSDSADHSLTPAKVPAAAVNEEMDQDLTEGDLEGFVLVEHRRQRTTGVPVLLTPTNEAHRLQQQNPLKLSAEVNTAAGCPILRHHFTARGGLLVEVAEVNSVNKLLRVRNLGDMPVQATIPNTYLQNFGLIKGVPAWYTDAELANFLQPTGVVAARRLYRRRGKPGDAATASDRVVLTFRPNTERPLKVNLGFTQHEVTEYIEAPPRCFNCQALGHIAKYCKRSTKCKKCGEPHLTKDCKGDSPVKCANCDGEHPADYVNCKVRLAALNKAKTFVRGPRQNPPSKEAPPPLESYPPLPPQDSPDLTSSQQQLQKNNKKNKTKRASSNEQAATKNVPGSEPPPPRQTTSTPVLPPPAGKRTYIDAATRATPVHKPSFTAFGSMTVSDIISIVFSIIRNSISQLPSGTFKNIIEGLLVLEPAITALLSSSCQSTG